MEKIKVLVLMHSVVAVFIMSLTYIARASPGLPRVALFGEEEWKALYRVANRTREVREKPYRTL